MSALRICCVGYSRHRSSWRHISVGWESIRYRPMRRIFPDVHLWGPIGWAIGFDEYCWPIGAFLFDILLMAFDLPTLPARKYFFPRDGHLSPAITIFSKQKNQQKIQRRRWNEKNRAGRGNGEKKEKKSKYKSRAINGNAFVHPSMLGHKRDVLTRETNAMELCVYFLFCFVAVGFRGSGFLFPTPAGSHVLPIISMKRFIHCCLVASCFLFLIYASLRLDPATPLYRLCLCPSPDLMVLPVCSVARLLGCLFACLLVWVSSLNWFIGGEGKLSSEIW